MICAFAIVLALVGWGLYLGATVELTNTQASNPKATTCAVPSTQKAVNDSDLATTSRIYGSFSYSTIPKSSIVAGMATPPERSFSKTK
jgi:hypothetical protein